MQFAIQREALLKPLQLVCSVVERRQTLPILSHVLLRLENGTLSMTATDLEVEMVARTELDLPETGDVTLPARKFVDICRALAEGSTLNIKTEEDRAVIRAGRSRFSLATLPAAEFPAVESIKKAIQFDITEKALKRLLEKTSFAIAQQDVRYYLNGLMLELTGGRLRAVATDGHRLALCDVAADVDVEEPSQAIVPRKGVMELLRLLEETDGKVSVELGSNHIKIALPNVSLTSKLIDGKFPDYQRVVPSRGDKIVKSSCARLHEALSRASILSNEKYRGVRLQLKDKAMRVLANNPEQEEAEEELEVEYQGEAIEIGFNVSYLLDAIAAVSPGDVILELTDPNSSCLITAPGSETCKYVVMPMRL